jgi:hypothetical protein
MPAQNKANCSISAMDQWWTVTLHSCPQIWSAPDVPERALRARIFFDTTGQRPAPELPAFNAWDGIYCFKELLISFVNFWQVEGRFYS